MTGLFFKFIWIILRIWNEEYVDCDMGVLGLLLDVNPIDLDYSDVSVVDMMMITCGLGNFLEI